MAELEDSIRDVLAPLRVAESNTMDDVVEALASLVLKLHDEIASLHKRNSDLTDGAFDVLEDNEKMVESSKNWASIVVDIGKKVSDITNGQVQVALLNGKLVIGRVDGLAGKLEKKVAFDLHLAFHTGTDHTTAQVFFLIAKADPENRERIRLGFPTEVRLWEEWMATTPESVFFEKYGVKFG